VAVKIKLKRLGKIREPYYRIVVADARTKRDGRAIEEIGKYHPKAEPSLIEVNSERVQHWLSVGAQPTDPVRALLKVTGDWQKFTGEPGAEGTLRTAAPREDRKERFAAVAKESAATKDAPAKDGTARDGRAKDGTAKDGHAKDGHAKDGTARDSTARDSTARNDRTQGKAASTTRGGGRAKARAETPVEDAPATQAAEAADASQAAEAADAAQAAEAADASQAAEAADASQAAEAADASQAAEAADASQGAEAADASQGAEAADPSQGAEAADPSQGT
jgi:small subunit ribosomal protein S16